MNNKPKILYVDDEEDNLTSFKYQFFDDYDIDLAISADDGFKLLEKNTYDIIISDQRMPGTSGTEFFADILGNYPDTIRIILTGYSDIGAVIEAINRSKVYYYLQKPIKESELEKVINNALEVIRLQRENRDLIRRLKESYSSLEDYAGKLEEEITIRKRKEADLILAKNKAEEANKLKTEFLTQVSHEIRTPINVILNFCSLIQEDIRPTTSEDVLEQFNAIKESGNRIVRTVDLILNMAQLQTNTYDSQKGIINLKSDIFEKLVKEYSVKAEIKNIDLNFSDNGLDPAIEGDSYSIAQIFDNLINNAIKYTDHGSVSIELNCDGNHCSVEIKDTGIGISQEFLSKAFEPFRQEEQGYTRSYDGIGLGLTLVQKYCQINNAVLDIKSEKGKGTTITVKFKLSKDKE